MESLQQCCWLCCLPILQSDFISSYQASSPQFGIDVLVWYTVSLAGFDAKDLQRAQFSLFSILAHTYHRLLSRFQANEALSKSKLQLSTDACWGRCIDVPAGVSTPTGSIARQ